ncbi:hypothetical protein Tco_0222332 [Tanacetum coccineum]
MPHQPAIVMWLLLIMEYLVNISKRRAFWSLSIKEYMTYPCLYSPKTTKETSSICSIQRRPIRRIEDIVCEDSGRYQAWSLLQETPNTPYPTHWICLRMAKISIYFDKEYSEEEEEEAMAETMEQYMSKTRTDYGSGVDMPKIDNKDQFELKGQFLKEL